MSTLTIFNLITSNAYSASASDWIALAELQVQRCRFGDAADAAVANLAAHFAYMNGRGGGALEPGDVGAVRSKRQGRLAVSTGSNTSSQSGNNALDQSSFGVEYKRLCDAYVFPGGTSEGVGCCLLV